MKKIKSILEDIKRNFLVAIVLGTIFTIGLICVVDTFEGVMPFFYISIAITTGGTVACIIYGITEYFKK